MKKLSSYFYLVILLGITLFSLILFSQSSQFQLKGEYLPSVKFELMKVFSNLTFTKPLGLYSDTKDFLYVVEQEGLIKKFKNQYNTSSTEIFIDLRDKVLLGGEQGLLGFAFHPQFLSNGQFFVDYTADNPRRTIISRFSLLDTQSVNYSSEMIILEVPQPFNNHNGGQIAFGPDGYLYIALGDGGSGGDPYNHGQNRSTLLGSILRLDVNSKTLTTNYTIPPDNPFVGNLLGYREEIFAYGLRNPWRFSFDSFSGTLWAADVGQNMWEEINIVEKGKNYGWRITEGFECYNPSVDCNRADLIDPIFAYGHDLGASITGGFIYRGLELSVLFGYYLYADFISGVIWALKLTNGIENYILVDTPLNIASFGLDKSNEFYLCAFDGYIYKLIYDHSSSNLTTSSALITESSFLISSTQSTFPTSSPYLQFLLGLLFLYIISRKIIRK